MGRVRRADRPKTSLPVPSARPYTVAPTRAHTMYDSAEDEEDICPVCEGECTCNNITESVTASNFAEFSRQAQAKASTSSSSSHSNNASASTSTGVGSSSNPTKFPSALPAGFRPSSSKGLPRTTPSSYATAAASPSPSPSSIAPRFQTLKIRLNIPSKHSDGTLSDSSTSTIDAPHHLPPGPQLARFPVPKHASASGSGAATPRNVLDDRIPLAHAAKMVPPKVIAKTKGKGKAPVDRKPASTVKKLAPGNPKKPALGTAKKRKLGRPHKKRIRETTSESSLSDFDDFDEDDFLPYRGSGQTQQPQLVKKKQGAQPDSGFATFVSASVFGGSETGSGSDSGASGLDLSGDSEVEAEEERLIVAEAEEEQRQRKFKELLMGVSHQNHTGGGGGQQWQIKPRRKSVEGEESDDEETSSESGGEEEEEEDEEDDPDEDEADGDEPTAAWSTDDSEEDLFFANLSDSSMSFSVDQDDDDDSETVSSAADLAEAANAGFLSGMGMPLVVMEDFGASIGLGMGLGMGSVLDGTDLDHEFEQRARAQLAEEKRSPEPASPDVFSTDYDYTKEAMDAMDGFEMDLDAADSDATEYEEDSDMDGDTTADEMERGRTPARLRFPTPPAINPLSTFGPSPAASPVGWRDFTPTHFTPTHLVRGAPHHTRAASFGGFAAFDMVRGRTISAGAANGTPSANANGSDGTASVSEWSSRPPVMGSFGRAGDRRRAAIIDGSAAVPSPFAARRRRSNSWKSGRKHFGTKSDTFPMLARRARQNSNATTGSARSSFYFPTETDIDMDMESCTEPFELDDVLDFSNVSDEHPHHGSHAHTQGIAESQGDAHLRSLDRWDRVPMGTFRRTRETHDAVTVPGVNAVDGFSYGSAARGGWEGGVLWGGGGLGVLGEGKELLSAVTAGNGDNLGNSGESGTGSGFEKAVSRKERRRRRKLAAASAAHVPTKSFITPPPSRKT